MAHVSGYTFLRLDAATADVTVFGARTGRASGAMGTAAAVHALIILSLWGLPRLPPGERSAQPAPLSRIAPFVFTASGGQKSGGRPAGGDRTDPAPLMRTRGVDPIAAPVAAPRSFATPDTIPPDPAPTPAWTVPVKPMDAGELPQIGVVDGVPGPPTARGPGDSGVGSERGHDRGLGPVPGDGIGDGPHPVGNGVSAPAIRYQTRPQYTPEAMRAKIQGVVLLSAVVGRDGTLRDIRVARSLDGAFGLDQQAIACVRQWRFRPGTRQGKPVAVHVTIEVAFNLR